MRLRHKFYFILLAIFVLHTLSTSPLAHASASSVFKNWFHYLFYRQSTGCEFLLVDKKNDKILGLNLEILSHLSQTIPRYEQKAYIEARKLGEFNGAASIKFNEAIDDQIRSDPGLIIPLLKIALNRLPYLKFTDFIIFLSGEIAQKWKPVIEDFLVKNKLSATLVLVPGKITYARKNRNNFPELSHEILDKISKLPSIFFDDSYSNGLTTQAIRDGLAKANGRLHGVFVVYEGGHGDPASLYKSGRLTMRPTSMVNFPFKPKTWIWKGDPFSIAIELDQTVFVKDRGIEDRITIQGTNLLSLLSDLRAKVVFLQNGRPIDSTSGRAKLFFDAYPKLIPIDSKSSVDIALGNWGNEFRGLSKPSFVYIKASIILETIAIGDYRTEGVFSLEKLSQTYFIDRLVDLGVFEPVYDWNFL